MIDIQFISKLTFFISNFFIAACHYLLTCSNHGYCSDAGTCQCDEGFYGDSCSSKYDTLLLVFSFGSLSYFLVFWPKHVRITYNWLEFKLILQKDIIKIKFTCRSLFHFFTSGTKNYDKKVIFLIFLLFSLFKKKRISINYSTNWIGIVSNV